MNIDLAKKELEKDDLPQWWEEELHAHIVELEEAQVLNVRAVLQIACLDHTCLLTMCTTGFYPVLLCLLS